MSKYPNISKLNKLTKKSSNLLERTQMAFKKVQKYAKYVENFDDFSLFWSDIISYTEDYQFKSVGLMRNAFDYSLKTDNNLASFGENAGNILISANDDFFGTIVYSNSKAALYLKVNENEIVSQNLSGFVPSPFNLYHDSYMKNFVNKFSHLGDLMPNDFIMQDINGFLFECKLIVKYLVIGNGQYFLASFQPCNFSRQIMIFDENGVINGYSYDITKLVINRDIRSCNIFELFPQIKAMSNDEIFNTQIEERNVSMMIKKITVKSTEIWFLYIMYAKTEIKLALRSLISLKPIKKQENFEGIQSAKPFDIEFSQGDLEETNLLVSKEKETKNLDESQHKSQSNFTSSYKSTNNSRIFIQKMTVR